MPFVSELTEMLGTALTLHTSEQSGRFDVAG